MNKASASLVVSVAVAGVTGAAVLSQPVGDVPEAPATASPYGPDVVEGLFLSFGGMFDEIRVGCIRCHEIDGSGNSSGAFPRLTDQSGWYLYKSLLDYAAGLRPNEIMGPIARQLSSEDMENLAAYYASIEEAPYPAEPEVDVQVLQRGGAIAAVGIPDQGVPPCTSCHGVNGIGQAPVYPYLAGQFAPYLEHQLMLWKQGRRGGDAMNVMQLIAQSMTDDQIHAVSVYFASIRPPEVTPGDPQFVSGVELPVSREGWAEGLDMGAILVPEPGGEVVVPGVEPTAIPLEPEPLGDEDPEPEDLPSPGPAVEVQPGPAVQGLETTVTTTGRQPGGQEDSSGDTE